MNYCTIAFAALATALPLAPLNAQEQQVAALSEALQIPALFDVMREEGLKGADDLLLDYGFKTAPQEWTQAVAALYDSETLTKKLDAAFEVALSEELAATLVPKLQSPEMQNVIDAEIAARRAMLDPDFEAEALELSAVALADKDPVMLQIANYVSRADLVERNVAAGLNSNLAFYGGFSASMGEGGGFDDLYDLVSGQTDPLRMITAEWLHAYFFTSYHSLEASEREAYFELMLSEDGVELSEGLMVALEVVFDAVSYDLGKAVGDTLFGFTL